MSKDHYVAKTYLKSFTDENLFYPYRKAVPRKIIGKQISPSAVCHQLNGDINQYLDDPEYLKKALPLMENNWARIVNELESGPISVQDKAILAGYLAVLRICTPTAKRLSKNSVENILKATALTIPSEALSKEARQGERRGKEMLRTGEAGFDADGEATKAMMMENLGYLTKKLLESPWTVLFNETYHDFVTSDNPLILTGVANRFEFFVPLKPKLGLLVHPQIESKDSDLTEYLEADIKKTFAKKLNKLMVKAAEKLVLYRHEEKWLEGMVKKYANWGVIDCGGVIELPDGKRLMTYNERIGKRR